MGASVDVKLQAIIVLVTNLIISSLSVVFNVFTAQSQASFNPSLPSLESLNADSKAFLLMTISSIKESKDEENLRKRWGWYSVVFHVVKFWKINVSYETIHHHIYFQSIFYWCKALQYAVNGHCNTKGITNVLWIIQKQFIKNVIIVGKLMLSQFHLHSKTRSCHRDTPSIRPGTRCSYT